MARVEPSDYHDLAIPSSPRVSPDRETVAFVRTIPDEEDSYEATIYTVPVDGGRAQRFTVSEGRDAEPRWSPSGDRLAFTSTRGAADDRQQLWVVPTDGGEGWQVTDVVGGISGISWSPDGTQIAFIQSVTAAERDEEADIGVPDDFEREDPDPRVIDRTVYRTEQRHIDGRHEHVYLVDVTTGGSHPDPDAITRVSSGDVRAAHPRWKDPSTLYFTDSLVGDDPDDSLAFELVRCDLASDERTRIHRSTGWAPTLAVSSRGLLAYPHVPEDRATLQQNDLEIYDEGTDSVTSITTELDRTVRLDIAPQWGPDERSL